MVWLIFLNVLQIMHVVGKEASPKSDRKNLSEVLSFSHLLVIVWTLLLLVVVTDLYLICCM